MKRRLVAAALATLAGCATPSGPQREILGSLEVDGGNAFINGSRAYPGASVRDGDVVTTGSATSVRVRFRDDGFVQLDENTDPLFRLFREGGCILVKIATGQAFVDARRICIEDPNLVVVLNSKVNWRIEGAQSVVTVIEGSVSVERPVRIALKQYDQYLARPQKSEGPPRRLTREQAEATTLWTKRFSPASRRPPGEVGRDRFDRPEFAPPPRPERPQRPELPPRPAGAGG
jgi:hypothetical protein